MGRKGTCQCLSSSRGEGLYQEFGVWHQTSVKALAEERKIPDMLQRQNEQAPTFEKLTFALISLLTCFLIPSVKFSKVGSAT